MLRLRRKSSEKRDGKQRKQLVHGTYVIYFVNYSGNFISLLKTYNVNFESVIRDIGPLLLGRNHE